MKYIPTQMRTQDTTLTCLKLQGQATFPWRRPSLTCEEISFTTPGPCGTKTELDFEDAPISFNVSKYWVTRTMSMTSFDDVPGTFSANARTLSLSPSTMAWRWRAIPSPARYFDSASPSALLMCRIFSASAFSLAAIRNLAAIANDSNTR